MKLSLSTNGWEKYGWTELFAASREAGFSGIELHGISQPGLSGPGMPFSPANISKTARRFADSGFAVVCVDALSDIADPSASDESVCEISECIEAAARMRCRYVRIHTLKKGSPDSDASVKALIDKVLPIAESEGIILLIETTGIYADTARLCRVLDDYASDSLAALWDMNHPYRSAGESPEQTIEHLGAYVRHVHMRDSVARPDGSSEFRLMGDGDLPVSDMMDALRYAVMGIKEIAYFNLNEDGSDRIDWNLSYEGMNDDDRDGEVSIPGTILPKEKRTKGGLYYYG